MSTSEYWQKLAACRGMDTNDFFPTSRDCVKDEAAKAVCARCSVRQECLDDAITMERVWGYPACGIRGGLNAKERQQIKRDIRAA